MDENWCVEDVLQKYDNSRKTWQSICAEHLALCKIEINEMAAKGCGYTIYTVPPALYGFPVYDVNAITLWLYNELKRRKFPIVKLMSDPNHSQQSLLFICWKLPKHRQLSQMRQKQKQEHEYNEKKERVNKDLGNLSETIKRLKNKYNQK